MIHDATIVDGGRKQKKMEIKKPYAVVQYHKFLKGVHIRSEVKLETFVNCALFCFTKGLALRNSIQLLLDYLYVVSEVLGSGA
jgi:hypothetical protein